MDIKGQLSLEYLLIFFISITILSSVSIGLIYESMDNINDMKNTIETKNTLTEIANNVNIIYASDYGSKKTVPIRIYNNLKIYADNASNGNYYLYSNVKLSDNKTKKVIVQVPCKVSFKDNSDYYYTSLYERWYYNTEIKWIKSSSGEYSVNVYFK